MGILQPDEINHNRLSPEPLELMLIESIQRFHADRCSGVSNFGFFSSIFSRLIQSTPDPPLEIVWFYAAVSFRSGETEVWERVRVVKELFGFMVSCGGSGGGSGLKKVAVLAPVVFELQRLAVDLSFGGVKNELSELKCLVEGVVSYVSMCCYESGQESDGVIRFSPSLMDVVSVWLAERLDDKCDGVGVLRLFVPMVSDEVRARICAQREIGFLAGSVMCEVFLLCLCLKCGSGSGRDEMRRELQQLVVQLISSFRDLNFFDSLLRTLLEPSLPVTHLLGCGDEILLRGVLYDVVMMVTCPFPNPVDGCQLSECAKEVALLWLLTAEKVTRYVRTNGDPTKTLFYENAFYQSRIPGQLIGWTIFKTGASRPVVSTPAALIRWLLAFENHGLKIFNDQSLFPHVQAVACTPSLDCDMMPSTETSVDHNNHDQQMVNSLSGSYKYPLNPTAVDGQRKRKDESRNSSNLQTKFIKVHCDGNFVKERFSA